MSRARAQALERRATLLELEAQLQRATLNATLSQWRQSRTRSWLLTAGKVALQVLSGSQARWLLMAALMRWMRRGKKPEA